MRQLPDSFLMIFLRRRQSMLDTFILSCCYCLKNELDYSCAADTGEWGVPRASVPTCPPRGFRPISFMWMEPPARDVRNHIWTPARCDRSRKTRPLLWLDCGSAPGAAKSKPHCSVLDSAITHCVSSSSTMFFHFQLPLCVQWTPLDKTQFSLSFVRRMTPANREQIQQHPGFKKRQWVGRMLSAITGFSWWTMNNATQTHLYPKGGIRGTSQGSKDSTVMSSACVNLLDSWLQQVISRIVCKM